MSDSLMRVGVVEDTLDPLKNGRVRVRVFGVHSDSVTELPTSDLPWAGVVQSTDSAAISGIGRTPRLLNGTWVCGFFIDIAKQKFMVLGSVSGIPGSVSNKSPADVNSIEDIVANIPPINPPEPITQANGTVVEQPYIGSLTNTQVKKLSSSIGTTDLTSEFKKFYTDLSNAGILSPEVVPEKTAGILYVAHYMSEQAAIDLIRGIDTQESGTTNTASSYYKSGYSILIGVVTNELPNTSNLTQSAIDKKSTQQYQDARKYDPGTKASPTSVQGFSDPSGKYPLKELTNESDINRLAKGTHTSKTIVGEKETKRITNIPVANGSATWNQSPIPYGSVYPNNQVTATESGHVIELDDTPGAERINIHHKAGTFSEIDNIGNLVERTAGIRTIIVEKDELVYIKGSGHVNLDGDLSIRVGGACNIEVIGNANLKVHGDFTHEVSGSYNIKASAISMKADSINLEGTSSFNITSSNLLLKSPTIQPNPWTGDIMMGSHLNTSVSIDVPTVASYSPTIKIPSPVSRQEAADFVLEDSPDVTSVMYQNSPAPVVQKSDVAVAANVLSVDVGCDWVQVTGDTQLSTNYKLSDLCGNHPFPFINGQHGLSARELACNLKHLAINVIEPLAEKYRTIGFNINGCFREAGSNISKSKKISQHELGQAVDISFSSIRGQANIREQLYKLAAEIRDSVPFDQLILEYRSSGSVWIHISFTSSNLRRQVLTLNNDKLYDVDLHLLV